MKRFAYACAAAFTLGLAAPVLAQTPEAGLHPRAFEPGPHPRGRGPGGGALMAPGDPAFMDALYPPEMIVEHHRDIGLSEDQQTRIETITKGLATAGTSSPFALIGEVEDLEALLTAETIDVDAALAQAEVVMGLEREMKLAHLKALIEIKNVLTPEQRAQLDALRDERREKRER